MKSFIINDILTAPASADLNAVLQNGLRNRSSFNTFWNYEQCYEGATIPEGIIALFYYPVAERYFYYVKEK